MLTMRRFIETHKHPLIWLYSTLFYLNLFVGLWLHHGIVIVTSAIGIFCISFIQPTLDDVPAWAENITDAIGELWQATPVVIRYSLMILAIVNLLTLLYALWENSILLTFFTLSVLVLMKAYFLRKAITRR